MRIGLISDTHGYLDPKVFHYFEQCDQIWHAGDFGPVALSVQLAEYRPLVGVSGNIDDTAIRLRHPEEIRFDCDGVDVWMTHIGGYPGRYDRRVAKRIRESPPDLFICGHSHVLRVMRDQKLDNKMLHLNPGAAGRHGNHLVRTMLRFEIAQSKVQKLQVIELGPRFDVT